MTFFKSMQNKIVLQSDITQKDKQLCSKYSLTSIDIIDFMQRSWHIRLLRNAVRLWVILFHVICKLTTFVLPLCSGSLSCMFGARWGSRFFRSWCRRELWNWLMSNKLRRRNSSKIMRWWWRRTTLRICYQYNRGWLDFWDRLGYGFFKFLNNLKITRKRLNIMLKSTISCKKIFQYFYLFEWF